MGGRAVSRAGRILFFLTLAGMTLITSPATGQQRMLQHVLFLPFVAEESEQSLSEELYSGLLSSIHLPPGKVLVEQDRIDLLLAEQQPSEILASEAQIDAFATDTGAAIVIGGKVRKTETGQIEVSILVYSREDRQILNVENYIYEDEEGIRNGIEDIGSDLSRARNFSGADSSFFISLLIPGLGQLQKQEPLHALVSAGLVGGALIYGLSIPKADGFEFDRDNFVASPDYATTTYRHFIRGVEVTTEEFFSTVDEDWKHHLVSKAGRRAEKIRKKRATGLFITAYLINVADTLFLTRKKLDTSPFFLSLKAVPILEDSGATHTLQIGFGLRFH